MNYMIYAWRSILVEKDIAERESTTITVDNVTVAEKIAVSVTEWMTDGEFGVTAVKCGEDIVTVIVQMDGEYLIDGDTYVNWRDVDDEIYYRIGEYASEKEMEQ